MNSTVCANPHGLQRALPLFDLQRRTVQQRAPARIPGFGEGQQSALCGGDLQHTMIGNAITDGDLASFKLIDGFGVGIFQYFVVELIAADAAKQRIGAQGGVVGRWIAQQDVAHAEHLQRFRPQQIQAEAAIVNPAPVAFAQLTVVACQQRIETLR